MLYLYCQAPSATDHEEKRVKVFFVLCVRDVLPLLALSRPIIPLVISTRDSLSHLRT